MDVFRAIETWEVGSLRVPPRKDSVKKFWRPTMVDCEGGPADLAPTTAAEVRNSGCTLRWKSGCRTMAGDEELAMSTFICCTDGLSEASMQPRCKEILIRVYRSYR